MANSNQLKDPRTLQLILLDRDGVINHDSESFVKSPSEWRPIEGSLQAIVQLQHHYLVSVVTNQSGLGRGLFNQVTLGTIHDKLNASIVAAGGQPVNIYYCPHHPTENCACRKPKPLLLQRAILDAQCTPQQTLMVGDSLRDLQAGEAAGCEHVFVKTGKSQHVETSELTSPPPVFDNLLALSNFLLTNR